MTDSIFRINPQSGVPIYRQLIEQIQRLVSSGQLQPGDPLPSVRQIALAHAVNTMTVSKAYSLLEAQGVLERQRGKAMTVAAIKSDSKTQRLRRLQPALEQLATAAQQLNLSVEDVLGATKKYLETTDA